MALTFRQQFNKLRAKVPLSNFFGDPFAAAFGVAVGAVGAVVAAGVAVCGAVGVVMLFLVLLFMAGMMVLLPEVLVIGTVVFKLD